MKHLKFAGIFLLAGCGPQTGPQLPPQSSVGAAASSTVIQESEVSKQSRVAKAYSNIQAESYGQYPAYVRYWEKTVDGNDALCFDGNGDTNNTRENCAKRDGGIELLKAAGWCRNGSFGSDKTPAWRQCGPARPDLLKISAPFEQSTAAADPENSLALDENGKPTMWNSASHAWEEY